MGHPRVEHHLQVALSGKRRFDPKTLFPSDVVFRRLENLASRCNIRFSRDGGL
jgi:hypothetical protein